MRIFLPNEPLPTFRNAVITIGTFDGVHCGHQQIIRHLKKVAEKYQGETVLITFEPHPRLLLGKQSFELLSPDTEKYQLLRHFGLDNVAVTAFTPQFSQQTPQAYVADFLVQNFAPRCIVIGYDHRFGQNRAGDFVLLEQLSTQYGFDVAEIPKQLVDDMAVSSTKIRNALHEGNVTSAQHLLGYWYPLYGTVVRGQQLGRKIGYPTANIAVSNPLKLVPANGVYAVQVIHNNQPYGGMLNIGIRPTVNGTNRTTEVHIFDFDEDIYDQTLQINFVERLRNEQKFAGLDALIAQLKQDEIAARWVIMNMAR